MRASRRAALIGIAVHTDVAALHRTLDTLTDGTRPGDMMVLVPDQPDAAVLEAMTFDARLAAIEQRPTIPGAAGNAAAYNRLAADLAGCTAMVLLENGARLAPDALDLLVGALDGEPGITGPSTNDAWNEQCVLPGVLSAEADLVPTAAALRARYGTAPRPLGPLHSLAEVCIVASAETIAAVGAADEGFGVGPCWEMEMAARAWRAGRPAAWMPAAFVHRAPPTRRRLRAEAGGFVAARRRYQDRMCGLRLDGRRDGWAEHCHGASCPYFAPPERIVVRLPLGNPTNQPAFIAPSPDRVIAMRAPAPAPACTSAPTESDTTVVRPTESGTTVVRTPTSGPLMVSCVMPTADRPEWAAQAIAAFSRQTHPRAELVIIDDGDVALADVLGTRLDHPSIVYRREPVRRSIGAKRNLACAASSGDVVIHWDDDDWYAPDRIAHQLGPISAGIADVTALRDAIWFDVQGWRFRRPSTELHRRLFVEDVHGGTLAFRRTLWESGARYPDTSLAEDAAALRLMVHRGARLVALPADGHYLYVRHCTNSWRLDAAYSRSSDWRAEDEPHWLSADRSFYAAHSPAAPSLHPPPGTVEVSCIMPTANRRSFVPAAIAGFLAQRDVRAELIIIDDGSDPVADLVPDDPRVRYWRLDRTATIGEKRNVAIEASTGEVIAHLDDDDWSHPERLRVQRDALLCGDVDVCGLDRMLWWNPQLGLAWRYACPPVRRPWVAGNTLAYTRATWQLGAFPAHSQGEDTAFVWGRRDRRVLALDDERLVVGTLHDANTITKRTASAQWSPVGVNEVLTLMAGAAGAPR